MEKVFIYNEMLGLKGAIGAIHEANAKGYYVVILSIKEKKHRALLPINSTVVIYSEPVFEMDTALEIE